MNKDPLSTSNVCQYLCKILKYAGVGNFWHEDGDDTFLYKMYHHAIFMLFYTLTCLEFLEMIFNGYPTDLHNDAVSFAMGHCIVLARMHIVLKYKKEARQILHDMIKVCEGHEEKSVLCAQYNKIKNALLLQIMTIMATMALFVVEGFRRMYNDGTPFIAVTTFWPSYESRTYIALAARICMLLIQLIAMFGMISCDTFVISQLIILSYKFATLSHYFQRLRIKFDVNSQKMTEDELVKWFKQRCLEGFQMHRELMRLSKAIYGAFGIMMSIQVCQSSVMIILILLRVTLTSDLAFTMILMNIIYISAVAVQLALYLWNAGEITYQASLISTAIFHCGWHLRPVENPAHVDVRRLVLMGCAQAQRPIVIKAFGVHDLSYQTFVTVMRVTYSLFAVLH